MHLSPARPRRGRWLRRAAGASAGLVALSVFAAAPAQANPPGPHDPFGAVTSVRAVTGGIRFNGWAADPDALATNLTVGVLLDGRKWLIAAPTSVANDKVTTTYGTGPTPGFSIIAPIDTLPHTACLVARNLGKGIDTVLRCVPTPLGTQLSPDELAARSPQGSIEQAVAGSSSFRVSGWATDPDYIRHRMVVVLYIDGTSVATVTTHAYPLPRPDGAGALSAYDIQVPVSAGMHLGCVWVVNVGLGSNAFQGCKARDTRGRAGTGTVSVPTLNTQVVGEAKKHLGQPYVWGAEGPSSFDCSGLVMYSYGKFGFTTPRVSEDQAVAARLIPASRAVAGDLVFYHDQVGDVYHVGIFLKPGLTIAAIDPADGVDYQTIWDPASATYGSFTHK